jgi:hypothetical protein
MDHRLIVVALLFCGAPVFAGYAQLRPPSNVGSYLGNAYTAAANDTIGAAGIADQIARSNLYTVGQQQNFFKPAANDFANVATKRFTAQASAVVAGRSVAVPVALKFSAKAGLAVCAMLRFTPQLMLAATVAPLVLDWLNSNEPDPDIWTVGVDGQLFRKKTSGQYHCGEPSVTTGCYFDKPGTYSPTQCIIRRPDLDGFCGEHLGGTLGWEFATITPEVDVVREPIPLDMLPQVKTDFGDLSASPLPKVLPYGLPVDPPIVNPEPDVQPGVSPRPLPLRVPVGDPIPEPFVEGQPGQYRQPVVDVVPSPTPSDTWRVDMQPKDVFKVTSDPMLDPESVPRDSPQDALKTDDKKPDLCDLYPDILACAKPQFDTPDAPDIQTQNRDVTITPDSGWAGGSGSCPASRYFVGAKVDFSFQPLCDGLSLFRPVILAFAWLSAAFVLAGMRQGVDS